MEILSIFHHQRSEQLQQSVVAPPVPCDCQVDQEVILGSVLKFELNMRAEDKDFR